MSGVDSLRHRSARKSWLRSLRTFTNQNIGTKKLKGISTRAINSPDGDFTCKDPLRTSLEPGESTVFRVVLHPTDDGRHRAILRIRSNDANEDPVMFKLSGLGMKHAPALPRLAEREMRRILYGESPDSGSHGSDHRLCSASKSVHY